MEVRRRSEELARKFIDIQRRQFKRLGVFGDWEHPYLTLDPGYEAEVLRAFAKLVERGLVYESKKPVYWSTGARTALAEAEVEYHEEDAPAIYVKFPLVTGPLAGKASMVIWTTTPWTLPAEPGHRRQRRLRLPRAALSQPAHGQRMARAGQRARPKAFCKATGYTPEEMPIHEQDGKSFIGGELEGWKYRHPFLERESRGHPRRVRHARRGHGLRPHRARPRQRRLRHRAQIRAGGVLARRRRRPLHRGRAACPRWSASTSSTPTRTSSPCCANAARWRARASPSTTPTRIAGAPRCRSSSARWTSFSSAWTSCAPRPCAPSTG